LIKKVVIIDSKNPEAQLQEALKECASLREENERLKKLLGLHLGDLAPTPKPIVSEPSTAYEKKGTDLFFWFHNR